ncbi:IclR family transcriptional regulator [Brevibacterium casei]|uniref:IclR family transcriptional regulator n=1 Tax=Brevibacterium casei TaxID=33889 RepID=UPI00344FE7DD
MATTNNQGRTLDRALDVLECVTSTHEPVTLTEISRATGLHLATTQRLIGQLVKRDYLKSTPRGYTLGPQVLPMSHSFVLQDRLALVAPSVLSALTDHTSLTSSVFVRVADRRVLVSRFEAPNPLSYQFPVGQVLGLFVGGGKVLLAHAEEEDQERLLADYEPMALSSGRLQNLEELRNDLEQIRETGYFLAEAERSKDSLSTTAPIWSPDDSLLGTINLVANTGDTTRKELERHTSTLLQASRRITAQM